MMNFQNKAKLKGFSLLEVLIMLTIVSFTMIAAMAVVAKANISVKNNEKLDVVNNLMIKSIELLKTPSNVYLSANGYNLVINNSSDYYFALKETGTSKYLEYNINANPSNIGTCNSSNFYYYPIVVNGSTQNYEICMQIRIRRTLNPVTNRNYYVTQTTVKYNLNGTDLTDSLITYRYENFASL